MKDNIYKVLETDRLILRKISKIDLSDIFEYSSDDETTEFMIWDKHKTIADTEFFYDLISTAYMQWDCLEYVFVLKSTGKVIGSGGAMMLSQFPYCVEIGYIINKNYWGHGLVPEAMTAVRDYLFELGVHRVEAKHWGGNNKSGRVMQKLGMTYEGTLRDKGFFRDKYVDIVQYAMINPNHNK